MLERLFVLTGAGASSDCAPIIDPERHRVPDGVNKAWQPPLVKDLFAERFLALHKGYPDVLTLIPDLQRSARTNNPSVSLEDYLRDDIRDSHSDYDRRRFRSIPLYLQEVLHECSRNFTRQPWNYNALINATFRVAREVVFITLNYDTILDSCLSWHKRIGTLDDYINAGQWSLIKLHGSTGWMYQIVGAADDPAGELKLAREITYFRGGGVGQRRGSGGKRFYPALSTPLGSDDEFNIPPEHLDFLQRKLDETAHLHFLVIGYSGIDNSVARLFLETNKRAASLGVVTLGNADDPVHRIAESLSFDPELVQVYRDGFSAFAAGETLQRYLATLVDP